jgi:hypothetical protein
MGGIGSGRRWRTDGSETTDDYRRLDVHRLHRTGYLAPHRSFGWQWLRNGERVSWVNIDTEPGCLVINYRHRRRSAEWQDGRSVVPLVWTPCNFGGQRPWFICPVAGCGRRVANLYAGCVFGCRRCFRLAFPCQRENYGDRASRRADKIRDRLKWQPGILNGTGIKPAGMHWRTYWRLCVAHDRFVRTSLAEAMQRFGMSFDELTS